MLRGAFSCRVLSLALVTRFLVVKLFEPPDPVLPTDSGAPELRLSSSGLSED